MAGVPAPGRARQPGAPDYRLVRPVSPRPGVPELDPAQRAVVDPPRRPAAGAGRPGHRQDHDAGRGGRRPGRPARRRPGVAARADLQPQRRHRAARRGSPPGWPGPPASRSPAPSTRTPSGCSAPRPSAGARPGRGCCPARSRTWSSASCSRGGVELGTDRWPDALRPALRTRGFAQELRDLLLRAVERGVGPTALAGWGRVPRPGRLGRGRRTSSTQYARRHRAGRGGRPGGVRPGGADPGRARRAGHRPGAAAPGSGSGGAGCSSTSTRTPTRRRRSCSGCSRPAADEPGRGRRPRPVDLRLPRRRPGGDPALRRGLRAGLGRRRSRPSRSVCRGGRARPCWSHPAGRRPAARAAGAPGAGGRCRVAARPGRGARAAHPRRGGRVRRAHGCARAHLLDGVPWREMAVLVRSDRAAPAGAAPGAGRRRRARRGGRRRGAAGRPSRRCCRSCGCWTARCGGCGPTTPAAPSRARTRWTRRPRWRCSPRRSAARTRWRCAGCGRTCAGSTWSPAGRAGRPGCWSGCSGTPAPPPTAPAPTPRAAPASGPPRTGRRRAAPVRAVPVRAAPVRAAPVRRAGPSAPVRAAPLRAAPAGPGGTIREWRRRWPRWTGWCGPRPAAPPASRPAGWAGCWPPPGPPPAPAAPPRTCCGRSGRPAAWPSGGSGPARRGGPARRPPPTATWTRWSRSSTPPPGSSTGCRGGSAGPGRPPARPAAPGRHAARRGAGRRGGPAAHRARGQGPGVGRRRGGRRAGGRLARPAPARHPARPEDLVDLAADRDAGPAGPGGRRCWTRSGGCSTSPPPGPAGCWSSPG